jgi:3-methyladenine DNA glycosylase AlkD
MPHADAEAVPEAEADALAAELRAAGTPDRATSEKAYLKSDLEFFIRKAIGWVLRETAKKRPALVAAWLEPRIRQLSGVTLREALKPLPPDQRAHLGAMAGLRHVPGRG